MATRPELKVTLEADWVNISICLLNHHHLDHHMQGTANYQSSASSVDRFLLVVIQFEEEWTNCPPEVCPSRLIMGLTRTLLTVQQCEWQMFRPRQAGWLQTNGI